VIKDVFLKAGDLAVSKAITNKVVNSSAYKNVFGLKKQVPTSYAMELASVRTTQTVKSVSGRLEGDSLGVLTRNASQNPNVLRAPANTTAPLFESARATGTFGGSGFGQTLNLIGAESRAVASGLSVINGGRSVASAALGNTANIAARLTTGAVLNATTHVVENSAGRLLTQAETHLAESFAGRAPAMSAAEKAVTDGLAKANTSKTLYALDLGTTIHPHWSMPAVIRGEAIERAMGQNLPKTFKTIDIFNWDTGTAISIKSRDLRAKTYLDPAKLRYIIKRDIDKLAMFKQGKMGSTVIDPAQINKKVLDMYVPHSGNVAQKEVFSQMVEYAKSLGIEFNVKVF
jgi:hypothetical protein